MHWSTGEEDRGGEACRERCRSGGRELHAPVYSTRSAQGECGDVRQQRCAQYQATGLNAQKLEFATSRDIDTLERCYGWRRRVLGLSVKDVVTTEMVRSMADKPIVFALANPDPEIAIRQGYSIAS